MPISFQRTTLTRFHVAILLFTCENNNHEKDHTIKTYRSSFIGYNNIFHFCGLWAINHTGQGKEINKRTCHQCKRVVATNTRFFPGKGNHLQ
jgi:hypothetical protein